MNDKLVGIDAFLKQGGAPGGTPALAQVAAIVSGEVSAAFRGPAMALSVQFAYGPTTDGTGQWDEATQAALETLVRETLAQVGQRARMVLGQHPLPVG